MPGSSFDDIRDGLARIPHVRRQPGTFLKQDGNLALVQVGDQQIRIPMVGYQPHPGTPVWVDTQNGRTVCAGSSYQFSPYGTIIASPASGSVQVQPDDGPVLELPYRSGLSLSSGNRVEINPVTRVVQGLISRTPDAPETGGGGGGSSFKNLLVQAADSGTSNGGAYWQNNVNSDSAAGGAWFYGSRLRNALKGVDSFTRVEVYLPRIYSRFSNPTIRLHASAGKPSSGLPSFGSSQSAGAANGWVRIPNSWGEYMRDNNAGVGFGPVSGVMASWRGTAADRMSGAIRFTGTR